MINKIKRYGTPGIKQGPKLQAKLPEKEDKPNIQINHIYLKKLLECRSEEFILKNLRHLPPSIRLLIERGIECWKLKKSY